MKSKKSAIITAVVVALIAVGAVVFLFLAPSTLSGDWQLVENPEITKASPDEASTAGDVFYSFGSAGEYGDGEYKTFFEGGVEQGSYKLSEKQGKKLINLGTEDLEYKISGSTLFGNATLTITYPERTDEQTGAKTPAQDYVFEQAKAPDYGKESYDLYKTDEALVSGWKTTERKLTYFTEELSYTETVEFLENGIMTIHYESKDLALDRYMYYAYSAENGKLIFSVVTDKDKKYTVTYGFEKNGSLKFRGDKTQCSIFSDAVFSDVAYSPVKADK